MDGIVAKRTLKKSYSAGGKIAYTKTCEKENKEGKNKLSFKDKILFKIAIQTVTTLAILTVTFAVKFLNLIKLTLQNFEI